MNTRIGRDGDTAPSVSSPEVELSAATPTGALAETGPELRTEEIAELAYSFWLDRGSQDGSAEQDWLRAEAALRARSATSAAQTVELANIATAGN